MKEFWEEWKVPIIAMGIIITILGTLITLILLDNTPDCDGIYKNECMFCEIKNQSFNKTVEIEAKKIIVCDTTVYELDKDTIGDSAKTVSDAIILHGLLSGGRT